MRFLSALLATVGLIAATSCTDEIGVSCPPGQLTCDNKCVSIAEDSKNCGGCGIQCAGEIVCISGQCTCPKDQTNCGDVCVRTSRDPLHCGGCGTACDPSFVCANGKCSGSCPAGQMDCDGSCVDPMTDAENCGGCGMPCGAGQTCNGGSCQLLCENNLTICGAACVDTQHDPQHCGDCATACEAGQFCAGGECVNGCPSSFLLCPNPLNPSGPPICVDPQNDPTNCGGCGTSDVQPPDVDLGTPPVLPHVCLGTLGANSRGVCVQGKCAFICDAGFADCGGFPDGPAPTLQIGEPFCATSTHDNSCNCGGCGVSCDGWEGGSSFCGAGAPSQVCCDSTCVPSDAFLTVESCGSCAAASACTGSAPGCCAVNDFGAGTLIGTCVSFDNFATCGGCGNDCSIVDGADACCDNGDGGFSCTNTTADVNNCGSCGNGCTGQDPRCCTGLGCVDVATDDQNCGACGNDCNDVCTGGNCVFLGLGSGSFCSCP